MYHWEQVWDGEATVVLEGWGLEGREGGVGRRGERGGGERGEGIMIIHELLSNTCLKIHVIDHAHALTHVPNFFILIARYIDAAAIIDGLLDTN